MFVYCFSLRRYPAAHIFMVLPPSLLPICSLLTSDVKLDHWNDIIVNSFGLLMSIIGTKFNNVWFFDPVGAICIALLILSS